MSGPPDPRHPPVGDPPVRSTGSVSTSRRSTGSASTSRRSASASPASRTTRPASDAEGPPVARSTPGILPVQSRLTNRDRTIIDWLDRHGVLTTAQITAALFRSPTTASHRLAKLRAMGVVDRFHRPFPTGGFGPWHWVIGQLGARIAAAARDGKPPTPATVRARHDRLTDSAKLPHLLGTNQFFIDLHVHALRHPGTRLVRWWSERETVARYHGRVHPDGHALWQQEGVIIGLFLEYDRGGEQVWRLAKKLEAFDELAGDGGPAYPVLFVLNSAAREAALHEELASRRRNGPTPVATMVRDPHGPGAGGRLWALVGQAGRRRTLAELPYDHGDPDNPLTTPNLHDPDLDQEL